MSSARQNTMPLLERRNLEITRLRAKVTKLEERVAELEAALESAKKKHTT